MEGLLPILANLSLHWSWSARHIASTIPSTVHVLCYQTLPPDTWFHTFAVRGIPWTVHCNASEPYTLLNGDTVLILANNPEETTRSIRKASRVDGAFRARFFLIQYSYVDETDIRNMVRLAWAKHLTQIIVLRFEDSAIYAVLPKCHEPEVIPVSAVQWSNLEKMDWRDCIVRVAVSNLPPHLTLDAGNTTIKGISEPYYRYAKAALHFQAVIIPTAYSRLGSNVIAGEVDVSYTPQFLAPKSPIEVTPIYASMLMLCVPASCVLASTTSLLWQEFTDSLWILLAASVIAIIIALRLLIPPKGSALGDSLFMMLSTLASVSVKFPRGHARAILGSWILAMLVLSSAYQTVLHSMMAAPLVKHEIENVHDLIKKKISLKCLHSTCPQLKSLATDDEVLAELAASAEEMETSSGISFIFSHQDTHAIYTTPFPCMMYYSRMRGLFDKGVIRQQMGFFGYAPSSPLAPALRQIGFRSEAAGLWTKWYPREVRKPKRPALGNGELQPITMVLLWPAILLLCVGLAIAFIVFLAESWWNRFKEKIKQVAVLKIITKKKYRST